MIKEPEMSLSEKTNVPLGWLVAGLGFSITVVVSLVLWASGVQNKADNASKEVLELKGSFGDIEKDIKEIYESQIRVEEYLKISLGYSENKKRKGN